MNVLIDTNVILDTVLKRSPFHEDASNVLGLIGRKPFRFFITASMATDLYYFLTKYLGSKRSIEYLKDLASAIDICSVNHSHINKALSASSKDFEDAVQFFSAQDAKVEAIITRDKSGFKDFDIDAMTPREFLETHLL